MSDSAATDLPTFMDLVRQWSDAVNRAVAAKDEGRMDDWLTAAGEVATLTQRIRERREHG